LLSHFMSIPTLPIRRRKDNARLSVHRLGLLVLALAMKYDCQVPTVGSEYSGRSLSLSHFLSTLVDAWPQPRLPSLAV